MKRGNPMESRAEQNKVKREMISKAIDDNNLEMVASLISNDLHAEIFGERKDIPIEDATFGKKWSIMNFLLRDCEEKYSKFKPEQLSIIRRGLGFALTAYLNIINFPDIEIVKSFLRLKANPEMKYGSNTGFTALHYAASKGLTDVLKLLLHSGYNVNAKSSDKNKLAIELAYENKHSDCVSLLSNYADYNKNAAIYFTLTCLTDKNSKLYPLLMSPDIFINHILVHLKNKLFWDVFSVYYNDIKNLPAKIDLIRSQCAVDEYFKYGKKAGTALTTNGIKIRSGTSVKLFTSLENTLDDNSITLTNKQSTIVDEINSYKEKGYGKRDCNGNKILYKYRLFQISQEPELNIQSRENQVEIMKQEFKEKKLLLIQPKEVQQNTGLKK
jgi:ankyrin repeat protein